MKIIHIVGARPNFMKAAPLIDSLKDRPGVEQVLVHTGQHYDDNMSKVFFEDLGLPKPDIDLEVGSGSHAQQTAEIMKRIEPILLENAPDMVIVYGDVNSTMATALVCSKLHISLAHVEAGLRSFDRKMPEEINRLLTDQVADLLFVPSAEGVENLLREGVASEKIHLVGNIMIDTLIKLLPGARERRERVLSQVLQSADKRGYGLVTLHRPSNVDDPDMLLLVLNALKNMSSEIPLIFPIHPRTRKKLLESRFSTENSKLHIVDPISYLDFLALQSGSKLVVTDSGGIQEETTYLGVPCLTLRENTERPITVTQGTNLIVGRDLEKLHDEVKKILGGDAKSGQVPHLWDGKTADRIAKILIAR
ncbi:MAG: UDP-N-acetylglucosamine 2-epimerase (non-hydrolyzing) [Candidatus Omnitrophica bacterium]|nr:UDP-N-acetylglucosamine 2-epimerase (non-hydrolyzing) [Candidatus Omnitrophota bacterium]